LLAQTTQLCHQIKTNTISEIARAIDQLDARSQVQLLEQLPSHLKVKVEDISWLRAAESAFDFWGNPEDAIYDDL
jgi:hypothetical protein